MEINLQVKGLDQVTGKLLSLTSGEKQLKFILMSSLNELAAQTRDAVVKTLPEEFVLRTAWWKPGGEKGFNVEFAKRDNLQARIYTRADWMNLQETGGEKITHQGRKMLAIPSKNVRPNPSARIPGNLKPRFLLQGYGVIGRGQRAKKGYLSIARNSSFIGPMKSGKLAIFQRSTNGRHLKLMYILQPEAKITPRLYFFRTAQIQAKMWPAIFGSWFQRTMETVR